MVKYKKISFSGKRGVIAITAAAATVLFVLSVATLGAAPFSYQQASDRTGPRINSANIVDGEVKNQDLAPDSVTSDKIKNGEVKAEDLDPSIQLGGGETPGFSLQVTERSNSLTLPLGVIISSPTHVSVQCNSDEIVTGGGFGVSSPSTDLPEAYPIESKKQDNGWSVAYAQIAAPSGLDLTAYAECMKIVNGGTMG
jgi:hypothetical protein